MPKRPVDDLVVAIVGPTGSGKSALAMEVASRVGGQTPIEIVALDAFTVYRGMDIGTATPTAAERRQVPHHLVDVLEPEEDSTVGWFQPQARAAIAAVQARGAVPLLVGGSGLYYRAVLDPLDFPPTDAVTRARIHARWIQDPIGAHTHLTSLDPAAASRVDPLNLRRTVRALEVIEITGRRFSSFYTAWASHDSRYPGLRVLGVQRDRATQAADISARVGRMLGAGWVEEARTLRGRDLSASARQAIGYAELFAHLDGDLAWEEMVDRITIRTRQFAVRQQRWFSKDPRVTWLPSADVVDAATRVLGH